MEIDGAVLLVLGVMQCVFITLKLSGAVDWRWIVVFTPFIVALLWIAVIFIQVCYITEVYLR